MTLLKIFYGLNCPIEKVFSPKISFCALHISPHPSESVRNNDPEAFYCSLLEQVYSYQNEGKLFICGDLNSRVGDDSDYIEGDDDVKPRNILDYTSNANGDLLTDFLVDCSLCMLNGRVGMKILLMSHNGDGQWSITCWCPMNSYWA